MRLRTERRGAMARVRLSGPVEASDLPRLRATLLRAFETGGEVVLDAASMGEGEVDLAFAQVVVAAARTAECAGKRFEIAGGRAQVLRALALPEDDEVLLGLAEVL